MKYTLAAANEFVRSNKSKVNEKYRLKYHMIPPVGWMNDPNGLIKLGDTYHFFYQFYPYDSKWGPMHWGHFRTKNMIDYEDVDVALAPEDESVESGCFSGGAILIDNKIHVTYTRHYETKTVKKECNYLAVSDDTINFKKIGMIFDNENLPHNYSRSDFRDPSPYKIGNKYYIFMGAKDEEINEGIIVVLESETLSDFRYSFTIGPFYEFGDMGECPSYHRINGMDVLVASGCHVPERKNSFKNDNSSVFLVGHIDFEKKCMKVLNIQECDKGDSFYAPQFIANCSEPIMIGWLEMWGKDIPTHQLEHGWAGAFAIPRILTVENNWVYQKPISLEKYYKKCDGNRISRVSHIDAAGVGDFKITFKSNNGYFTIENSINGLVLDTSHTNNLYPRIRKTDREYESVKLEILLDTSSVELFINDGEYAISSRIYLDDDYDIEVNGNVELIKNNLIR